VALISASADVIDTEMLVEELDALPAQRAAAMRALHVSGDPRSSAADLGSALMADPAITAQIIKLANSAYYGLSGRVASVPFAVTVVGFVSVRSVVAAFAAGALGADAVVPPGFWERASASAAATSLVAKRVDAPRPDAFSMGLLHELGDFLLFRASPEAHAEVHHEVPHWDCRRRSRLERERFGIDHGQLLGRSLAAWLFPDDFVRAVDHHCEVHRGGPALARAVVTGQAIGTLALRTDDELGVLDDMHDRLASRLDVGGVAMTDAWVLSRQARIDAAQLVGGFVSER
jgi:HD-like signal output (HDOD) protein